MMGWRKANRVNLRGLPVFFASALKGSFAHSFAGKRLGANHQKKFGISSVTHRSTVGCSPTLSCRPPRLKAQTEGEKA